MSENKPADRDVDRREFDVVVQGATGFTGRLVAEHLLKTYGTDGSVRWAVSARNPKKLEQTMRELGGDAVPQLTADSHDGAALRALCARTHVIASTVGPFAEHGSELVAACAETGTHYCDITGEVHWIREMIDTHHETARKTGARIVHCCGFDSIPSDLGVAFLHEAMREREMGCEAIDFYVRTVKGGFSGGTVASMMAIAKRAANDKALRRLLADPYSLNPEGERQGPDGRDAMKPEYDPAVGSWTAPFVMASVNTRIVRRSNALLDYRYGRNFAYREVVTTGPSMAGRLRATAMSAGIVGFLAGASFGPTRAVLQQFLPDPGEGPDAEARANGRFEIILIGRGPDGTLEARVRGDRDPGYGATSRMLGESAVCLATTEGDGGILTPASAMGSDLIERLQARAGLDFAIRSAPH